jgi:uncharacterized protein with GYD domain
LGRVAHDSIIHIALKRKRAFDAPERRPAAFEERSNTMPTYIGLETFTEEGIKSVKDTVKRSETFKEAAKAAGVTVKDIYWTQGAYDLVLIAEAPDDATMSALALSVARLGFVRGQTMRGFTAAEMSKILEKLA